MKGEEEAMLHQERIQKLGSALVEIKALIRREQLCLEFEEPEWFYSGEEDFHPDDECSVELNIQGSFSLPKYFWKDDCGDYRVSVEMTHESGFKVEGVESLSEALDDLKNRTGMYIFMGANRDEEQMRKALQALLDFLQSCAD